MKDMVIKLFHANIQWRELVQDVQVDGSVFNMDFNIFTERKSRAVAEQAEEWWALENVNSVVPSFLFYWLNEINIFCGQTRPLTKHSTILQLTVCVLPPKVSLKSP